MNPCELENNPLLEFINKVNTRTGELEHKEIATVRNIDFMIVKKRFINIKGSFHKYSNDGVFNHNRFSIKKLFNVLEELTSNYGLNPNHCHLHNIEFGVNIILPFPVNDFLNAVVLFKGTEYNNRNFLSRGKMLKFIFSQYELKLYDKGMQYGCDDNILRIEIKVIRMEYLKYRRIDLECYSDLLNMEIANKLAILLTSAVEELLVYDSTVSIKRLSNRERIVFINGKNPRYWVELKTQSKEKFKYYLKSFRKIAIKYGTIDNIQKRVVDLMKLELNNLMQIDLETTQKINYFLSSFEFRNHPELTEMELNNLPHINHSNSMLIKDDIQPQQLEKCCLTCGRDISGQKRSSKYCSEKYYGREVKKCRNDESNPRHHILKRLLKLNGLITIFDIAPFIVIPSRYHNSIITTQWQVKTS